jgi:hypothetical protein
MSQLINRVEAGHKRRSVGSCGEDIRISYPKWRLSGSFFECLPVEYVDIGRTIFQVANAASQVTLNVV